jgi:integrase
LSRKRNRGKARGAVPQLRGKAGTHALTEAEVGRLLEGVPHLEDEALLRLAINTGIRREDLVAVRLEAVDLDAGWISFWEAKKRRTWKVPVAGRAAAVLRQHMNTLPRSTPWLFPSPRNPAKHASGRHAYNVLQERLAAAGLAPRPFHALRATCIKLAQRRRWTVEQVMALTGDSWRVIQEHYATPTEAEMAEAARARPIEEAGAVSDREAPPRASNPTPSAGQSSEKGPGWASTAGGEQTGGR